MQHNYINSLQNNNQINRLNNIQKIISFYYFIKQILLIKKIYRTNNNTIFNNLIYFKI